METSGPTGGELAAERWTAECIADEEARLSRHRLETAVAHKFRAHTDHALIREIEQAPGFNYDDQQVELNRRLAQRNQTWRWATDLHGKEVVEVYDLEEPRRAS